MTICDSGRRGKSDGPRNKINSWPPVMYVEVSDEAACSAGSFAINPFAR